MSATCDHHRDHRHHRRPPPTTAASAEAPPPKLPAPPALWRLAWPLSLAIRSCLPLPEPLKALSRPPLASPVLARGAALRSAPALPPRSMVPADGPATCSLHRAASPYPRAFAPRPARGLRRGLAEFLRRRTVLVGNPLAVARVMLPCSPCPWRRRSLPGTCSGQYCC